MNGNKHLSEILQKYSVERGQGTPVYHAGQHVRGLIGQWYAGRLESVHNSGSFAKGTAIRGGTDLDLFISLRPGTGKSMRSIFDGLHGRAIAEGLKVRRQNVSLGVDINNVKVDLVPGRKHKNSEDHSLYVSRNDSWIKTNVARHIKMVKASGRTPAIQATKIWRRNRGIKFPSFYLELAVIRALQNHSRGGTASELKTVLQYLATKFASARFVDPSNDANVISDELSRRQKQAIANQAKVAHEGADEGSWDKVIW